MGPEKLRERLRGGLDDPCVAGISGRNLLVRVELVLVTPPRDDGNAFCRQIACERRVGVEDALGVDDLCNLVAAIIAEV